MCVCVCVGGRSCLCPGRLGVCMRERSLVYPPCNSYARYSDVICGPSGSTSFFDIIS